MIADLSWRWPKRQDSGLAMVSLPASLHLPAQAPGEGARTRRRTSQSSQYRSSTVGKLTWWSSTRSQWSRSRLRSINSVSRHLQLLSGLRWGPIPSSSANQLAVIQEDEMVQARYLPKTLSILLRIRPQTRAPRPRLQPLSEPRLRRIRTG
jgi:hypothetical protein